MIYSYTQISQYLRCPRSYRYRYLDGWREKETRAAMAFGRCFETALGAYFRQEDCGATLFKEWEAYRDAPFEYKKAETWDRFLHQGIHLLQQFVQDDRVRIQSPRENLQIKILRPLLQGSDFVAYLDAIGEVDGTRCLIDWKTTSSRYSDGPDGLLSLDPQLICYSWMSGISEVALVVFVRKQAPEIQYLRASISEEQSGIWTARRDDHRPGRGWPLHSAQRNPVPPKRLRELLPSGALPQQRTAGSSQPHPQSRSDRP